MTETKPVDADGWTWIHVPTYELIRQRHDSGGSRPTQREFGRGAAYTYALRHWGRAVRETCEHPPNRRAYRLRAWGVGPVPECGKCGAMLDPADEAS